MDKFAKVCLIISGVLIGIGVMIGIIVTVIGGQNFVRVVSAENVTLGEYHDAWDWGWNYWGGYRNELVVNNVSWGNKSVEDHIAGQGIDTLYITAGAGEFKFQEWDEDDFKIEISGRGECDYYIKDGKLYVEGFKKLNKINGYENNRITLYVPDGVQYDYINLEIGAGKFDVKGIQAKEMNCDVGMGAADLKNMDVGKLEMQVGMGEITFAGKAAGDVTVSCGMGHISMKLEGSEQDYNYALSCAAGSINLANQSFSMLAGEKNIDNHAANNVSLECAMGSINVDFMK